MTSDIGASWPILFASVGMLGIAAIGLMDDRETVPKTRTLEVWMSWCGSGCGLVHENCQIFESEGVEYMTCDVEVCR